MRKGHLLRFFSFVLFFISFCFFTTPTYASTDTPFSNFALTAGKSTSLGIPEGQDDLFYHNNIMFYAWCPNGSDGGSTACESVTGSQVTWIGDSYSSFFWGGGQYTYDYIEEKLPGVDFGPTKGDSTSYVQGSKFANSGDASNPSGISILEKIVNENKLRDYLVFALGTNGGGLKSSEVNKVLELAKNKHVIFVTARTRDRGENVYNNDAVRKAAEENENVTVVDWVQKVGNEVSKYYGSDEIHPTSDGLKAWVNLIIESLPSSCGINIVSGGKTPEEKTWIGFRRLGYTPIQTAGIMGNSVHEGFFNPASWEGGHEYDWGKTIAEVARLNEQRYNSGNSSQQTGMGILGFTFYTHLDNLVSIMEAKAPDYLDIIQNPSRYSTQEDGHTPYTTGDIALKKLREDFGEQKGEEIFDILLSIQIIYIDYSVKDTSNISDIDYSHPEYHQSYIAYTEENFGDNESGAELAAKWWEREYEKHAAGTEPARYDDAKKYYNKYKDFEVSPLSSGINSSSSNSSSSSSSNSTTNSDGTANYDSIMHAKNADKSFFNGQPPELSAAWDDNDTDSMKRLLENYGDLAYQLGRVVNIPYVAVLTQMRYEDSQSVCGKNNFWGNGCDSKHATTGGATIQGENLGEGFSQYAQTLTNGLYDSALGLQDPKQYLETIGPMWVQGSASGAGYGSIEAMKSSIDKLQAYIDSPEGQAIVKTFGNYHENSSSGADECGNGEEGTTNCTSSGIKIAEKAVELAWPNEQGQCETSTGTKIQYVGSANSDCDTTPKPAYKEAFQKYGMSGDMKDCGHFAATVIMASEVDPDFPKSGTSNMISYMEGNGNSKWERIQEAESDETKLKPGDLLINSTHVEIYVGDYGGDWGVIADASQGERVGEIGYYGKTVNGISNYKVFRAQGGDDCDLSGGLSKERAQKLADNYNNDTDGWMSRIATGQAADTPGYPQANCTRFSAFFMEMFTNVGTQLVWANGGGMVAKAIERGFSPTTDPQPYSIFSTGSASWGHTGVIVGKNDDGTFITVEAAYNGWPDTGEPGLARVFPHKDLSGATFASLGNQVDTSKLMEFINK